MGESMTRERLIEQAKKWRQTNWYNSVPVQLDEALAAYGEEQFEAGVRLGREDSDNVYWPALCEQWRIEFGKELGQEGGHIMCVVDGVKELIRQEREQCLSLAVCALDADTVAEAIRARGVAQLEKNAKI